MTARCPHYKLKCKDEESKHCYIVKNTTSVAQANLRQLRATAKQTKSVDSDLQKQIQDIEQFLSGTMSDRGIGDTLSGRMGDTR